MEDRSIIIGAVLVLVAVLFILLVIPASKRDILGTMGSDTVKFGAGNATPSVAPTPNITELQAQRIQVGSGSAQVAAGDTITVHYVGAFTDGKVFDSSYQRNEPFTVQIGANQVIPGFEQGVVGMLIGEKRRLLIPANLAYGAQGQGSAIPPNTPLIFEVELLNITPAQSAQPAQPSPEPTTESAEPPTPSPNP